MLAIPPPPSVPGWQSEGQHSMVEDVIPTLFDSVATVVGDEAVRSRSHNGYDTISAVVRMGNSVETRPLRRVGELPLRRRPQTANLASHSSSIIPVTRYGSNMQNSLGLSLCRISHSRYVPPLWLCLIRKHDRESFREQSSRSIRLSLLIHKRSHKERVFAGNRLLPCSLIESPGYGKRANQCRSAGSLRR